MLNFGKINFSASFNPTSAFPLDARSYFESYEQAFEAAKKAKPVGSTDSLYYYGQTLVVVENNEINFYIIQTDNTLKNIPILVNEKIFDYNKNNSLSLRGFDEAASGMSPVVDKDGLISWSNFYTQSEIDNKLNEIITKIPFLQRKVINSITEIDLNSTDAEHYIYMVPTGLLEDSNRYDEYIVLSLVDADGIETKFIEQVGSWNTDLTDYVTTKELAEGLLTKVNVEKNKRLITETEADKLESLLNIVSIDDTLELDSDNALKVKKVSATQVVDLESWIEEKAGTIPGLSELNFSQSLALKLNSIQSGAEKNLVRSICEDEFELNDQGTLCLKSVPPSKIDNLPQLFTDVNIIKDIVTWKSF